MDKLGSGFLKEILEKDEIPEQQTIPKEVIVVILYQSHFGPHEHWEISKDIFIFHDEAGDTPDFQMRPKNMSQAPCNAQISPQCKQCLDWSSMLYCA